jgi:hypothetical protein
MRGRKDMKRLLLLVLPMVMIFWAWNSVSFAETGACCLRDGSCIEGSQGDCDLAAGIYQGDYTECTSAECPSVQITDVSVDREGHACHPYYYPGSPIAYTVEYVVGAAASTTYDMKVVVKPRSGKKCKRRPPRKGMKGTARGLDYDIGQGPGTMTVEYRPNNPDKQYVVPKCAKYGSINVRYIVKLYNADTGELVATDTYTKRDQMLVTDPSSRVPCTVCHAPHSGYTHGCTVCHSPSLMHSLHINTVSLGCVCCHGPY